MRIPPKSNYSFFKEKQYYNFCYYQTDSTVCYIGRLFTDSVAKSHYVAYFLITYSEYTRETPSQLAMGPRPSPPPSSPSPWLLFKLCIEKNSLNS